MTTFEWIGFYLLACVVVVAGILVLFLLISVVCEIIKKSKGKRDEN